MNDVIQIIRQYSSLSFHDSFSSFPQVAIKLDREEEHGIDYANESMTSKDRVRSRTTKRRFDQNPTILS